MEGNERTFTQEEVNTIVQDRLAKEKAKYEKQLSDMQVEVSRREKRLDAQQKLKEKGLPDELIELVNLDNDDAMNTSLELLTRTYRKPGMAGMHVAETHTAGTPTPSGITPASGVSAGKAMSEDAMLRQAMNLG